MLWSKIQGLFKTTIEIQKVFLAVRTMYKMASNLPNLSIYNFSNQPFCDGKVVFPTRSERS